MRVRDFNKFGVVVYLFTSQMVVTCHLVNDSRGKKGVTYQMLFCLLLSKIRSFVCQDNSIIVNTDSESIIFAFWTRLLTLYWQKLEPERYKAYRIGFSQRISP